MYLLILLIAAIEAQATRRLLHTTHYYWNGTLFGDIYDNHFGFGLQYFDPLTFLPVEGISNTTCNVDVTPEVKDYYLMNIWDEGHLDANGQWVPGDFIDYNEGDNNLVITNTLDICGPNQDQPCKQEDCFDFDLWDGYLSGFRHFYNGTDYVVPLQTYLTIVEDYPWVYDPENPDEQSTEGCMCCSKQGWPRYVHERFQNVSYSHIGTVKEAIEEAGNSFVEMIEYMDNLHTLDFTQEDYPDLDPDTQFVNTTTTSETSFHSFWQLEAMDDKRPMLMGQCYANFWIQHWKSKIFNQAAADSPIIAYYDFLPNPYFLFFEKWCHYDDIA